MKKIPLKILTLSHSVAQSNNYAVVLIETSGSRRLPIIIGGYEAQAIAVAWENMVPNRPLTHDLLKNTMDTFEITMKEVIINKLLDGVFYAVLLCERDGYEMEVDSRTSDALAMAVRFKCPIYTYESILETAGIIFNEEDDETDLPDIPTDLSLQSNTQFSSYSENELETMLEEALKSEDYEEAARIRDEIKKRQNS
jgi:uncharacterized protein